MIHISNGHNVSNSRYRQVSVGMLVGLPLKHVSDVEVEKEVRSGKPEGQILRVTWSWKFSATHSWDRQCWRNIILLEHMKPPAKFSWSSDNCLHCVDLSLGPCRKKWGNTTWYSLLTTHKTTTNNRNLECITVETSEKLSSSHLLFFLLPFFHLGQISSY